MNTGNTPDNRLQTALAALQASRAALRRELLPSEAERQREEQESAGKGSASLQRWWRKLRRRARRAPILNLAAEAARSWWRQQPWHASAEQITHGVLAQGRPLVRRHPLAAVALAAAGGAALVACRPWGWQALGQPLRAMPGRATHWLLAQLASAPVQAALASLLLNSLRAGQEPANDKSGGADRAPATHASDQAGPGAAAASNTRR